MNRRAVLVMSEKGGVGKSTFARALLDCLRWDGSRCAAFDGDGQVGQLLQYHGQRDTAHRLIESQDPLIGCGYFNIRDEDDRDTLINALSVEAERLVIDLPGGVLRELGDVLDEGGSPVGLVEAYARCGYTVSVVVVMTPVLASIRSLYQTLEWLGPRVDCVAVKNLAFGDPDDFVLLDGLETEALHQPVSQGKQALLERHGTLISLPALKPRSYALLDIHSLRFIEAIADARLPLADRLRIRQWLIRYREALEPAASVLGLTPERVADFAEALAVLAPALDPDTESESR